MQYKMKDSGVEWIKSLPVNWEKGRIKYSFYLKGRIGWRGLKSAEFLEDGPFYLITGTDFENGRVIWERCYRIAEDRYNEAPEIHVKNGDLLITKDGTIGKIAYIDSMPQCASLNSHLLIIRPLNKKYSNRYLFWVLLSSVFEMYCGLSQKGSIMASLSQEKMSDFCFPLPPPKEQSAIADYLDEKCGAIDEIIEQAKATIEEYKAWKSSVIFEAVTKGLDPNVEMKDSGVDIIGLMPKHWNLIKVKFCTSKIGSGKTPRGGAEIYTDSGIMLLRSQNIYSTGLVLDNVSYISEEIDEEMANTRVFADDILLNITGGSIGRCCIYPSNLPYANVNQHVCIIRVISQIILPKLMLYIWMSNVGQKSIDICQTGANREGMNFEQIGNTFIPIMDYQEQKKIVQYLDEKCATIDGIIAEKETLIADMDAYKKSLIFETVTGKRKVC